MPDADNPVVSMVLGIFLVCLVVVTAKLLVHQRNKKQTEAVLRPQRFTSINEMRGVAFTMRSKLELEKLEPAGQDFIEYRLRISKWAMVELKLDQFDQRMMRECDSPDATIADKVLMLQVLAYRIEQQTKPPEELPNELMNPSDIRFSRQDDAIRVRQALIDLIKRFGVVRMSDLKDLAGLPVVHYDENWGWRDLSRTSIHEVRDKWAITFPTMVRV